MPSEGKRSCVDRCLVIAATTNACHGSRRRDRGNGMSGNTLHPIGVHRADAMADVVFVHGLDGTWRGTWTADGASEGDCWLEWLAAERPQVQVWSLQYSSASSAWRGRGMDVLSAATSLLDRLPQSGIGTRPIIFVTHSLGGLVAKQILRSANESNNVSWKNIAENTRGISFLATPHSGAPLAKKLIVLEQLLGPIGWLLRRQRTIDDLVAHSPQLLALNSWYRDHSVARGLANIAYREDVPMGGVMVVSETSADPGLPNVRAIPIARDHVTICKPADKDDQVYVGVRKFVDDCLRAEIAPSPQVVAPATPPPSPSVTPVPAPVPASLPPVTRFFGREAERAVLLSAALDDDPQPLVVLGQAGIGKSALTMQVLHAPETARKFGARRFFVRLDTATDVRTLWTLILQQWGEMPGPDPAAQVLAGLSQAPALLVLDNGETPWQADAAGSEAAFAQLACVPGLKLIVSIRGQVVPLGVAWRKATPELQPLPPDDARILFLSIADTVPGDDPDLPELLKLVDGLPLAITLLAHLAEGEQRVAVILGEYRARRLALKVGEGKDRDLAASIELSLAGGKLSAAARRLFGLAGRLPAGIADDDAGVLVENGQAAARALRQSGLAFAANGRTLMLAPIREYAAHCLISAEDLARAVGHYFELLAEQGGKIGYDGGAEALGRLLPEMSNCEALVALAVDAEMANDDLAMQNVRMVVKAGPKLAKMMQFSGVGSLESLSLVVVAARRVGDVLGEAQSIEGFGDIANTRSIHDAASEAYAAARSLYKQVGDTLGEANCIFGLGDIALRRSDHDSARQAYLEARPLYSQVGDTLGEANCIYSLGNIALERSDYDAARQAYAEARPYYKQVGDTLGEANCIRRLGDIMLARADYDAANKAFLEARPLYKQVGAILGEANCISRLGDTAFRRSDHDVARKAYAEARALYKQVGSTLGQANCVSGLGDIAGREGDRDEARRLWQEALELYERTPEPYSIGMTRSRLARSSEAGERLGHVAQARAAWVSIDRPDLVAELDAEFGQGDAG